VIGWFLKGPAGPGGTETKGREDTPERIVLKQPEGERLQEEGKELAEMAWALEINAATVHGGAGLVDTS